MLYYIKMAILKSIIAYLTTKLTHAPEVLPVNTVIKDTQSLEEYEALLDKLKSTKVN